MLLALAVGKERMGVDAIDLVQTLGNIQRMYRSTLPLRGA